MTFVHTERHTICLGTVGLLASERRGGNSSVGRIAIVSGEDVAVVADSGLAAFRHEVVAGAARALRAVGSSRGAAASVSDLVLLGDHKAVALVAVVAERRRVAPESGLFPAGTNKAAATSSWEALIPGNRASILSLDGSRGRHDRVIR